MISAFLPRRRPGSGRRRGTGVSAVAVLAAGAVAVAGCSSGSGSASGNGSSAATGAATATASASSTADSDASSSGASSGGSGGATFTNPVYSNDYPDPAVLRSGSGFYAYATQGGGANIQSLTSSDLVHWRAGADALPEVGSWAGTGSTWAPEVIATKGRYVLFYVAHDNASGKQCVGRAESGSPAGPFRDGAKKPFVCQDALGGSIDPNAIRAGDGHIYLYWKNDGNCCGQAVSLWGQTLSADAATLTGKPVRLLSNTRPWQGKLIEAPEVVEHAKRFYLFYSANDYASDRYAIGYATCTGALGPCTDRSLDRPLVASTSDAAGPGHCFVLTLAGGKAWIFFHAWPPDSIGSSSPGRQLWLEPLTWNGTTPVVAAPSSAAAPAPQVAR